jgi:hypothetical protein
MCLDQGMVIVPWEALGGGKLMSAAQRDLKKEGRQPGAPATEHLTISEILEEIASEKRTTVQVVVSSRCPLN